MAKKYQKERNVSLGALRARSRVASRRVARGADWSRRRRVGGGCTPTTRGAPTVARARASTRAADADAPPLARGRPWSRTEKRSSKPASSRR